MAGLRRQQSHRKSHLQRKRHLALLRTEREDEGTVPGPDEVVLAEERHEQVRRALEALGERDREVLLLWDAGLSYREIAEVMNCTEGAVKTHLHRGKLRLRDRLLPYLRGGGK